MFSPQQSTARVYTLMRASNGFLFALMATINLVYQFRVAHLDPLQLLLVGSVLELTCLLLQVPTGLLADTYSRKSAVVAGTALVGAGFLLEATVPHFWAIIAAQVIWGAGASLADGADDAWMSDEVDDGRAPSLFLRGSQLGQLTGLAGVVGAVALATVRLNLPIQIGGIGTILLALALAPVMREDRFRPAARDRGGSLAALLLKAGETAGVLRAKPLLLSILLVTAFAGASSEGFDRLYQVHLLKDTGLPRLEGVNPLLWFAVAQAGSVIIGVGVTEVVRRRLDLGRHRVAVRALLLSTAVLSAGILSFALASSFPPALLSLWVARGTARVWQPVQRAWLNQSLESGTRATLFSVDGQADALGQIAAGPGLGLIARISIPAALVASALLLLPALAVVGRLEGIARRTVVPTTVQPPR